MESLWSCNVAKVQVSSKLPSSPAVGYSRPEIRSVATEIECDDDDFMPLYSCDPNCASLRINIPEGEVVLPHQGSYEADCGVSINIPAGYKCSISSSIAGLIMNLKDSKRIRISILNTAEKMILKNKQNIAKIWVEPVYFFDWTRKV